MPFVISKGRIPVSRTAFFAVTLIGLVLFYLLIVAPAIDLLASQRDELNRSTLRIARFQSLLDQRAQVDELISTVRSSQQKQAFLSGASDGAASADLQERIKQICTRAGTTVQSIQGLDVREAGGVHYMGARLSMSGPIAAVRQALASIERGPPFLFVDALTIRASPLVPASMPTLEPMLDAQLDIYGAANVAATAP